MSLGLRSLGTVSLGLGEKKPRTEYGFLLFDFAPNTQGFMTETFDWVTQVSESKTGVEQRFGLALQPRVTIDFASRQIGADAIRLDAMLYGSNSVKFAVPAWQDAAVLTAPADGVDKVYLDTAMRSFKPGMYLVFVGKTRHEFGRISTIEADAINLEQSTFYNWPAGSVVYPLQFAYLLPQRFNWLSSSINEVPLQLQIVPGESDINLPEVAAPVTYDGLEVLEIRPNWLGDMSVETDAGFSLLDNGVGVLGRLYYKKHARFTRGFKWFLNTRAKIQFFREFIARRKGRLVPFWLARPSDDLQLAASASSTASLLNFKGVDHYTWVGINRGRDHLAIRLVGGVTVYKKIIEMNVDAGNTVVAIEGTLGRAIAPVDVLQISFLTKCRLAADRVTIPWRSIHVAEPETFFVSLI